MNPVAQSDLLEICPYSDDQVPEALRRVSGSPIFEAVRTAFFPKIPSERLIETTRQIRSSREFQEKIISPAIDALLAQTSSGLTASGLERNPPNGKHVYISNHRDIILDPALFVYGLVKKGWDSPLICLGDNLLSAPWIIDLMKSNRAVTVKRNLSQRELLHWSYVLSELINRSIHTKEASVWIAQREGRAKDGNDLTHPGVLKMLGLSRSENVLDRLEALHIVPLAISYEFDPCDARKAAEVYYTSQPEGYQKKPGEDVRSMGLGIQGFKGRIHVEIGKEITEVIALARSMPNRKEQVGALVAEIDRQIHQNYRLWPSNYIAFDVLEGNENHHSHYLSTEKQAFLDRMKSQLATLAGPKESESAIQKIFLEQYANPVRNQRLLSV